jgi:hypothetical protein
MVRMRAEFVGPFGRHGRNFQTIESRLCIVLCVKNVQGNREACRMWNAFCNPFLECKKHETGWYSSSTCELYWRTCHEWFNGKEMGETLVHNDPRSGRPSVVNEDLVRVVEEKIQENRRFTISSLSLNFPHFSRSLLHEIMSDQLRFRKLCSRWVAKMLTDEHKMKQVTWHA